MDSVHPNENVVGQTKWFKHAGPDDVAVILSGHRLDHHRLRQMRGTGVVLQPRPRRPVEREVAYLGSHFLVVGPGGLGYVAAREAAAMRHHQFERNVGFAMGGEFRQIFRNLVHEGQLAFFDQGPKRRTRSELWSG